MEERKNEHARQNRQRDPLQQIPGVGKNIAQDLRELGIFSVADLKGRDPQELYRLDCLKKGFQEDPCQLYVFRCAVYFADHENPDPEKLKWWYWKDKEYPGGEQRGEDTVIREAKGGDRGQVLSMMDEVKESFPGFEEKEFLEALDLAVSRKEAFLAERQGEVAGLAVFSGQDRELTFLAVRPEFRKQGIGKRLIERVISCFPRGEEISVITFREGDPEGTAARRCYLSCGFVDGEDLTVFDYPCRRMRLKVGEGCAEKA